jgi:hypothetical protein
MNFDFGDILTRAWRITWKNKGLWVLGILASFLSGGSFSSGSNGGGGSGSGSGGNNGAFELQQFQRFWEQYQNTIIAVALGVVCLILVLGLISTVLGLIGRGGLIAGARKASAAGQVSLGEAWSAGTQNMGRLFTLWLITDLPFALLGLLLVGGVLLFGFNLFAQAVQNPHALDNWVPGAVLVGLACLLPLLCVLGLAGVVARILNHMGTLAAVLENLSGMAALRRGWAVLRANPAPLIILGVVFAVISGVLGFVAALPMIAIVLPAAVGVAMGVVASNNAVIGGSLIFAALCCVAYVPILFVVRGVFETWAYSAWTLTYDKLTGPATPAPVIISSQP